MNMHHAGLKLKLCALSRAWVEPRALAEESVHGSKEGFGVVRARERFSFEHNRADRKAIAVDGHDRMTFRTGTIPWHQLPSAHFIARLGRSGNVGLQIDGDVMETSAEVLITKERIISMCWVKNFNLVAV